MATKYGFFTIESKNGEYEYTHRLIYQFEGDINEFGENLAKHFYGGEGEEENGWYMFDALTIAVRFSEAKEMTKEEYDIVYKFM